MVRHILRALLATTTMLAAPTLAGPKPPDVPNYSAVTPQYSAGSTANTPINANTSVPYRGLTGIETSNEAAWKIVSGSVGDDVPGYVLCTSEGGTGECKFRTTCNMTQIAKDDPIRNYGQPGTSHLHMFYGAEQVNAWTTYAAARNSKKSACAGGSLNNTAYWFPAFTKVMGDGKTYAVRYRYATVYYVGGGHGVAHGPFGLRFVSGAHMDNNWSAMDAAITAANAQPGTAGRYSWGSFGKPHALFVCNGIAKNYIKSPTGTDPWSGACTAGVGEFNIQLDFSACWDGVNLWSTDGYSHVVPFIFDSVSGTYVCPKTHYQIFKVALQAIVDHAGPSDYMTWTLSSDAAFQTMLNASSSPRTIGVGESFHADWLDGWDPSIRYTFETKCMGTENGRGHECNDSLISDTEKLILNETPPDNRRLHQVTVPPLGTYLPTSTANMWLAPTTTSGTKEFTVHP